MTKVAKLIDGLREEVGDRDDQQLAEERDRVLLELLKARKGGAP